MFKKLAAIVVLLFAAFFLCGWFDNVETSYRVHVVRPGETLNGIAAAYYGLNSKGYISLDDYAMMVRIENRSKHNLERKLQIGDRVMVPVYVVK